MWSSSRARRLAGAVGAAGGALGYYYFIRTPSPPVQSSVRPPFVLNSWTTNHEPSTRWNFNWDHRDPKSIVKPSKGTPEDDNRFNEQLENRKSHAVRHLFFIRHGQYNVDGKTDKERTLTELGKQQAQFTGQRLKQLGIAWDRMEKSTMTRAQETGELIAKQLDIDVSCKNCPLLEEGAPIPPEPPVGHWRPEPYFFQEGSRIEAAFRKHVHRAPPSQEKDSYTLIVCHANVIRYFVCRALQFPPEAWLRISLNHASITWLSIQPNGRVILHCLGDTGHMDPKFISKF